MVLPSTNNVQALQKETAELKAKISNLERQIAHIQKNCQHLFFETPFMRKCIKCQYVEILYY
jgi:predicted  nucleic acid-binding Zn-ribbon protein